jgi:rhamnogalacturonyl hydrolase YesR
MSAIDAAPTRRAEPGLERALALLVEIARGIAAARSGRVYVDSLYGDRVFLWRLGDELDRADLRGAALELALRHLESLQDPKSTETSTTALVETAITQNVSSGDLDASWQPAADVAWSAIEHRIDPNGHFLCVSFRPGLDTDPARYEHVPAVGVYPWRNGAYLRSAAQRAERLR